ERIDLLQQAELIQPEEATQLKEGTLTLPSEVAEHMVENHFSVYSLPMGIAFHFLIDGKQIAVPMATEEPSVIAAANYAAKIIQQSEGFQTSLSSRRMIGQVALKRIPNMKQAKERILAA